MTGGCGVLIATRRFWSKETSAAVGSWPLRGCLFVLGAALAFTFAIRPLGFVVAGPVAIVLAALASRETKLTEIAIFAIGMTAFCTLLFRYLLGLPIPVAPWLLHY
jgi:putative tricarboxylic transport membrane protein